MVRDIQLTASAIARATARTLTVAAIGALSAKANTMTTNFVDALEIAADTNITVAANEVLKIEYVHGGNPVTVTKSGSGRLEIATSSISNLSIVVSDGVFASARPQAIPLDGTFRPSLRLDASDASTITYSTSNGTNLISKVEDADGNGACFKPWSWAGKPYVAFEKLNGLSLIDFGTMKNRTTSTPNGHGAMFGLYDVGPEKQTEICMGDVFYVWKDRDDTIDFPLINGNEFNGPCMFGNNPSYHTRGIGGNGTGFAVYASGMGGTVKENIHIDGQHVLYTYRVPRGFHVFRNRAKEGASRLDITTIGYSTPYVGGLVLAEAVIYSNRLSEATALRVEAQLQSKWLGMKLKNVLVMKGATLDVGAFPFKIGTLGLQDSVAVTGATNLCFDTLTRASSNVVVSGVLTIDGGKQSLMPDLAFDGVAEIDVVGTSRVQTVSSTAGLFRKTGAGELRLVDPVMSNITVSAGALTVSPLYARSAEYHLDATQADTIEWTETDGKKQVSAWYDTEDSSRKAAHSINRKPKYDTSRCVNKPFLAENAVGHMTMIDFGTFANPDHQDGWGACLDISPSVDGLHDVFVSWIDDPAVKNYPYGASGDEFPGPCFLGMQYHWTRGKGGAGNSFAVHSTGSPGNMWNPPEEKRVIVDGVVVHGTSDRLGDGVHVLSQRTTVNDNKEGAPIEEVGGHYQQDTYGGLKIGEVFMFKEYLTDRMRMRVSGALCSKWRGDTNEWVYGSINVAAGATLNHPYADLVPDTLNLAGKITTVSVKPGTLQISGVDAVVEGELRLADGGRIQLAYDIGNGFTTMKATSVYASGGGDILFSVPSPSALVGQEFRIVESSSVTVASDFVWRASSLRGSGIRANLKAKPDGLYLAFEGSGIKFILR